MPQVARVAIECHLSPSPSAIQAKPYTAKTTNASGRDASTPVCVKHSRAFLNTIQRNECEPPTFHPPDFCGDWFRVTTEHVRFVQGGGAQPVAAGIAEPGNVTAKPTTQKTAPIAPGDTI